MESRDGQDVKRNRQQGRGWIPAYEDTRERVSIGAVLVVRATLVWLCGSVVAVQASLLIREGGGMLAAARVRAGLGSGSGSFFSGCGCWVSGPASGPASSSSHLVRSRQVVSC